MAIYVGAVWKDEARQNDDTREWGKDGLKRCSVFDGDWAGCVVLSPRETESDTPTKASRAHMKIGCTSGCLDGQV